MTMDPNRPSAYDNGCVLEHRKVYEDFHECCLLSYVDIHHKDGDKCNNKIDNLEPLYHDRHMILEAKNRPPSRPPGFHHSAETIEKMIKVKTGRHHSEETKRKIGLKSVGRIHSIESRMKISKKLRGRIPKNIHTIEHSKAVADSNRRRTGMKYKKKS